MNIIILVIFITVIPVIIFMVRHRNKSYQKALHALLYQTNHLPHIRIQNIRVSYLVENGSKQYPSINNTADIYVFNDFLIVYRRQNLVFKFHYKPYLVGNATTSLNLPGVSSNKPDEIIINSSSEIQIKVTDPVHKHYQTKLTLSGLSREEADHLLPIKQWTS